jgi:uncharacterized protein (TIGR00251 family)
VVSHTSPKAAALSNLRFKVNVKVKTNSRKESVEQIDEGSFVVRVNIPPLEGRANERVIELLAEHFQKPKSAIHLVSGTKSKTKVFAVN